MSKVAKNTDPKKKYRIVMTKVGKAPDKSKDGVELGFKRGAETTEYKAERTFTGNPAYGKESPKNKDASFIEEARAKKQDIAYDNEGKPYRAGQTTVIKKPDQFTTKIKVTPDIRPVKIQMVSSGGSKMADNIKSKTAMPKKRLPPTVSWLKQQKKHERGY